MVVLTKIIEQCKEINEPLLVFSGSLRALDYIEEYLKSNGQYKYLRMEGSTPTQKREEMIRNFNNKKNGIHVFIISIHTGSLGVNLTAASRVVLLDMHFNPTHNLQAAARVKNNINMYIVIFL